MGKYYLLIYFLMRPTSTSLLLVTLLLVLPALAAGDPSAVSTDVATRIYELLSNFPAGSPECSERAQHIFNKFLSDPTIMTSFMHSGKGLNDLGDLWACNSANFSRYMLLQISGVPMSLGLGICGPKECTEKDYYGLKAPIAAVLNKLLTSDGPSPTNCNITSSSIVFADPVERRSQYTTKGTFFYLAMGFFGLVVFLNLLGYTLNIIFPASKSSGTLHRAISCFDFAQNLQAIFAPAGKQEPDLRVFNGIRVFSMLWVILGHTFYYSKNAFLTNIFEVSEFIKQFRYCYILGAPFSVDAFFFISGFLAAYLLVVQLKTHGGRIHFLKLYLHRVLRIMPMYVTCILLFCFVLPMLGTGPGFHGYIEKAQEDCGRYWHWHMLFINNFLPSEADCMGFSWYIANDMQFFLIVPVLVHVYHKRRTWGYALIGLLATVCTIIGLALCFKYNLSASFLKFNRSYFEYYYYRPYNRISPYLIGVLCAYLYFEYKSNTGETRRGLFSRFSDLLVSSSAARYALYAFCISGMLSLVHAMYWLDNYPQSWEGWPDALYLLLSKPLFVIFLFGLVYPAMLGKGRTLQTILGHACMLPFARVTFGTYLLHPMLMTFLGFDERKGGYMEHNSYIIKFFGYAVVSYTFSAILSAAVESPVINIDREFVRVRALPGPKVASTPTPEWAKVPENENDAELEKLSAGGNTNAMTTIKFEAKQ